MKDPINRNFRIVPTGATNLLSNMRANDTFNVDGVTFRAISNALVDTCGKDILDECLVSMQVAQLVEGNEWMMTRMENVENVVVERADVVYDDTSVDQAVQQEANRRAKLCVRQTRKLLLDDADWLEKQAKQLREQASRIDTELEADEYGTALTIAVSNLHDNITKNRGVSSVALRLLTEVTAALEGWNNS